MIVLWYIKHVMRSAFLYDMIMTNELQENGFYIWFINTCWKNLDVKIIYWIEMIWSKLIFLLKCVYIYLSCVWLAVLIACRAILKSHHLCTNLYLLTWYVELGMQNEMLFWDLYIFIMRKLFVLILNVLFFF